MLKKLLTLGIAGALALAFGTNVLNTGTAHAGTGDATQLVFTPSLSDVGVLTSFTAVVAAQDAGNQTDTAFTGAVTLTVDSGTGTLTGCTAAVNAVAGVATFTGCQLNLLDSYELQAASGALTDGLSGSFNVNPLVSVSTAPAGCAPAVACTTQPVVTIRGDNNTTLTSSDGDAVTLSVQSGPGTLTCTQNPVNTTQGVAAFAGCSFSVAGTYVLSAVGPGVGSVSTQIAVAAAAATNTATHTPTHTRTSTNTPTRTNTPVPGAPTSTPVPGAPTSAPAGGGAAPVQAPSTGTGPVDGGTGTPAWLIAISAFMLTAGAGAILYGRRVR